MVSHSPWCLEGEMGMGWNWVSVLTGLDSMSDKSSKLTLQFAGGGHWGSEESGWLPDQSEPATVLWVPTPRPSLLHYPPSSGSDPKLPSLQGPPGKGISQGTLVTAPLKLRCFPGLPAPSTKYLPFNPPQGLPVQSPSLEIAL